MNVIIIDLWCVFKSAQVQLMTNTTPIRLALFLLYCMHYCLT